MPDEIPNTDTVARRVQRLVSTVQASGGATAVENTTDIGAFDLTLLTDNTLLEFIYDPLPGQVIIFIVRQGPGAPWTWTPAANMKLAGGDQGTTSTVEGHCDIYTLIFDGTDWNETARAMDVG